MAQKSDELRESADLVQFKLRMREELRAKIESAAEASGRSMNAEIVERLSRSIDFDGGFADHLKPALMLIAHDAWRVEQHTQKKWTEDRITAHAIADLAGDSFRYATPMIDQQAISAAHEKLSHLHDRAQGRLAYLRDTGAAIPLERPPYYEGLGGSIRNALAGLSESALPPAGWERAVAAIEAFGWQLTIDLEEEPSAWTLTRDGVAITDAEKVGVAAVIRSFDDYLDEAKKVSEAVGRAMRGEEAAKKEAKAVLKRMREGVGNGA